MAKSSGDVRKQAWKFQEGAVVLALTRSGVRADRVHWDRTPNGMSIDPDVVVGADPDKPEAVIFVTHAAAEMAGQKKFWRTVAEAIEAKRLPSHPKILSVLYPGNVKGALKELYKSLFDACLHLDETSYGESFSEGLDTLTNVHGKKDKGACLTILEEQFDKKRVPGFDSFALAIDQMLRVPRGPKHALMASSAFGGAGRVPIARQTSLRRSVCKLYSLPLDVREALLQGRSPESAPAHAVLLGWLTEGLADVELCDAELGSFVKSDDPEVIRYLCDYADAKLPSFRQYADTLRAIGETRYCNLWIDRHFDELKTRTGMERAMRLVYQDSLVPLREVTDEAVTLRNHWLFQSLMAMLRAETGRKDGYGYSELGREAGRSREINALAGTTIAPFIKREQPLEAGVLGDVSRVLAGHLKRLGRQSTKALLDGASGVASESIFQFQMMNYRYYNPLDWLVCRRLAGAKIRFEFPANHDSFLSARADAIASRTGNLVKLDDGQVWIKCQSAYDGRIDKRKELCGRVGAMKLCYSTRELAAKRFFLVVDGFFDDEDLRLLAQAGWDSVYYYDELDQLIDELR